MFNWIKKWFKKPSTKCSLTIEVLVGGNIVIGCEWPDTKTNEEVVDIAKKYAGLIYMLNTGKLASILNDAVSVNGNEQGRHDLAQLIITILEHNMPVPTDKSRPLVDIHEAFLRGDTA